MVKETDEKSKFSRFNDDVGFWVGSWARGAIDKFLSPKILLAITLPAIYGLALFNGLYNMKLLQYQIVKDKNGRPDSISLFMTKGNKENKKTFLLDKKAINEYNIIIEQAKKFDQLGTNDTITEQGWSRYSGMETRIKSITPHSVSYLQNELLKFAKSQIPDSLTKGAPWDGEKSK